MLTMQAQQACGEKYSQALQNDQSRYTRSPRNNAVPGANNYSDSHNLISVNKSEKSY